MIMANYATTERAGQGSATQVQAIAAELRSGPGAAALLGAGIGCAAMGVFAVLGDAFKGIAAFFNIYHPAGPLSGVSTGAILVWLASWYVLHRRWRNVDVDVGKVSIAAFILIGIGFAFTFPPIMDFVQGK
jgi:hypothetical protein